MNITTDQIQEKLDTPGKIDEYQQDIRAGPLVQGKTMEQYDDKNEAWQLKHDGHKTEDVLGDAAAEVDHLSSRIDPSEITEPDPVATPSLATQTPMAEHTHHNQEALNQPILADEERFINTQQALDHRFQKFMDVFGEEGLPQGEPELKALPTVPSPREPQ
jgi:hypothetical protein